MFASNVNFDDIRDAVNNPHGANNIVAFPDLHGSFEASAAPSARPVHGLRLGLGL
ncbi:MAG: hypothetical protein IPJ01_03700 [Micavibrio sp.]|nr:hypothetical protein [Micavibrio sp.]